MFIRAGRKKHKKIVRVGDQVSIRAMPGETPRSRVDRAAAPRVASIRRHAGAKLATVEYTDSSDGATHLVELPSAALRGGEHGPLRIGEQVVVHTRGGSVLPAVGSKGTVLGGRDELYTVTFVMTHSPDDGAELAERVTVTQDYVPRAALTFAGGAKDDEDSDSGSDSDSDSDGESDEEDSAAVTLRPSPSLSVLRRRLSGGVRDRVMQMLSLEELDELASRLPASDTAGQDLAEVLRVLTPDPAQSSTPPSPSRPDAAARSASAET